jgi:hypothetical protein
MLAMSTDLVEVLWLDRCINQRNLEIGFPQCSGKSEQ